MYSRQRTFALYLFVIAAVLGGLLWPAQITARSPQEAQAVTPQLFFPVMHKAFANPQDPIRGWNGVFSIQNLAPTTPASVQVTFYTENGQQVVSSNLTPVGGSSLTNPFTLAGGAAVTFDMTSVSSQVSSGKYSIVVASDQPLAGVGWTRISGGGMSNGMYNALTPAAGNTVYLPALKINASGVGGNLAIQNLSNAGVSGVLVKFYNQQGQEVQQINAPSILPFSSFHLSSQQFGIPPGFDGSVVVSSPSPVAVVNNQLGGSTNAGLATYTGSSSGATALSAVLNLTTKWVVMNPSPSQPANVTVTSQIGQSVQQMIGPLSSHTFDGPASNVTMLYKAISDQPVIGVAVNQANSGTGGVIEAGTQGARRYAIPFMANQHQDANGNTNSSLVVYNTSNTYLPFRVIRLNPGGGPTITTFQVAPESMTIQPNQIQGLTNGINSLFVEDSSPSGPGNLFVYVSTQTQGSESGDGMAYYAGIPLPEASARIQKTANKQVVRGGDTLTYNLRVSVGDAAGRAGITDDLPEQFTGYTYSVSPGLVVTATVGPDYVWDAFVPASGGVISITGVVTSPVDVVLNNVASISAASGNASSNVQVLLDVTPPDTAFVSKPPSLDKDTTPTFTFTGNDSNAQGSGSGVLGFVCKVDNGNFASCTTPYTTASLSDGEHTLQVSAIDLVGHVDPTPASYTWTIDTTAPAVPALSSPATSAVITSTDVVTLTWEAVEDADVDGYNVTLNGQSVDAGNVTQRVVGPLANGVYSWTVSSYDGAGNSSANAGVRTFTVDKRLLIDPEETITAPLAGSGGFTPTLTIPAGSIALTGTLEMSYQPLPTEELPAPPEGSLLLGFSLDLFQNGAVQSGVVFSKPITISIAYDSALVSDPSSLQLFYLNQNNEWSNDGITIVTPVGNPLIATLTHLTDFGLAEVVTTRTIYLPAISR